MNDESAIDFAKLIRNWTDDLTIYTNGAPQFDTAPLKELGVAVMTKPIASIAHRDGQIEHLVFEDGSTSNLDALYHRAKYEQHCKIPEQLGVKMTDAGYIEVNNFQQTSVPGIYAVGDATTFFRAVSIASASGSKAGAMVNHEIIDEVWAD
ncbi:MAG: FAD-dependent oxidoreductase [Bacteroidota bacterium]